MVYTPKSRLAVIQKVGMRFNSGRLPTSHEHYFKQLEAVNEQTEFLYENLILESQERTRQLKAGLADQRAERTVSPAIVEPESQNEFSKLSAQEIYERSLVNPSIMKQITDELQNQFSNK
ncbi:MAG: hypothetical protein F6K58_19960 [Symploca sp. SIO2E9]|nr:hypothetical protein [Symploca sp. SIO2E9]